VNDITATLGTPTVAVPLLVSPSSANELIGAMNISFAAGQTGDSIPILNSTTEFDGSIWDEGGMFVSVPGTPGTHNALSAVAMLGPSAVSPNGTLVTYTLDTSALPAGQYALNPDFQVDGVGSSADTSLTFSSGVLTIEDPDPVLAALVSVSDVTVPFGTPTVTVPLHISPGGTNQSVGAMNISFAAGQAADAIRVLNSGTEFDGSIWQESGTFTGASGTPGDHNVLSAVAMLNPLQVSPSGTIVTYTLDTSALAAGSYELNPDFQIDGIGTSADLPLRFTSGTLHIESPPPVHDAVVTVEDIAVPEGTPTITVPIRIAPASDQVTIGAMNISFAAGQTGDAIPILSSGAEFDGSIWDNAGSFTAVAGTPGTHRILSAVAMLSPLEINPNGTLLTYTLDTSSLAAGTYELNPNYQVDGVGTSADISLAFSIGKLFIEPTFLVGDYNGNGFVEQGDLDLVLLSWGANTKPPSWIGYPLLGGVDQEELDQVLLNWGDTRLSAATVPEASTIVLGMLLVLACAARRPYRALKCPLQEARSTG
jgi:hypothetical protein